MDLHKAQIQAFFDIPVDHLFAAPVIIEYLSRQKVGPVTIVSPDVGGAERARAYAKRIDGDLAIIDKRRSDDGTAEVMNVVGDVRGRVCVIADDIIDTAGTIQKAAQALKDSGASRVLASAVHGVLSGPAMQRIEAAPIDRLVITNTVPLTSREGRLREGRGAVGRPAARAGHSQHSRGDVGLETVCVDAPRAGRRRFMRTRTLWKQYLEAVRREAFGRNNAGRMRRAGPHPGSHLRWRQGRERVARGRPEAAPADSSFRVGRQHADQAEGRRRRRRYPRARQGISAAPGHAAHPPRRLLPCGDGQDHCA